MSFTRHLSWFATIAPGAPGRLLLGVFFAVLAALVFPVPIFAIQHILQNFLLNGIEAAFPYYPCLVATLAVLVGGAVRILSSYYAHEAAFAVGKGMRITLMRHLGQVSLHWFAGKSTGELKKTLTADIGEVENFIAHNITDFIYSLLLPCIAIVCLFIVDWRMGFIMVCILAAAVYLQAGSMKAMRESKFMDRYNASLTLLHADAVEFVQGMPVVKIFNRTTESFSRMQTAIENLKEMQNQVHSFYAVRWARYLAMLALPVLLIAATGALFFSQGSITLDALVLSLLLGSMALLPISRLMRFVAFIMRTMQGWNTVQELLALPVEERGFKTREDVKVADLCVQNLHVCYEGRPILNDISFTAKAGTVTAIVGPSGSGKSALAAVLAGMEKIKSGSITLGGIGLQEFSNKELARSFSMVFQSPFLFSGTVRENIRLGREDATSEEVEQAVRITCCDDLIAALPQGYDTKIGAGGTVHLSGGQRQRIALARMALRDTPVVLLDEATAFADPESESEIQAGLAGFLSGKTVLVIAHRLPSIAAADTIIVLDQGRITEQGRHTDLLRADGIYARLWEAHHAARSWSIESLPHKEVVPC
ncbi:MAG: ABC transporter ATP-binding protein/permease [Desulfovibrio sp.]|jgi:ATP-binding cassette subfamily B protein|nr:ABC transporter ATP-binding protein/permease [Desulfovibrio sp.]